MILVTGYAGQLGYDVVQELNKRNIRCIGVDKSDFDITDAVATEQFIKRIMPEAVIHCSAYTAVDGAEENKELCRMVNVSGTANIARVCRAIGARMLYISTDYVFSGKPSLSKEGGPLAGEGFLTDEGVQFHEVNDECCPCNIYGQSKLDGELAVKGILEKYYIVRTSWVCGHHGKNFIETMLKLGREMEALDVVNDQIGSPTFTEDLARLIGDMIITEKYGTYHATNEGVCSWAEFAAEIMRLANLPCRINPILSSQYPTKAVRPLNSRLSKKSLDVAGFRRLPQWRESLQRYFLM